MRTAITTAAMVLMASSATAQVWNQTDSGNLLWQKEQANQIILVPSGISQPVLGETRLYRDSDSNTWGTVSKIGENQYLVNQRGEKNQLTIVNENPDGSVTWK